MTTYSQVDQGNRLAPLHMRIGQGNDDRAPADSDVGLVDSLGRTIDYLRISVTDRCDFRCTYCMSDAMTFLPRRDLLSLEEIDRVCSVFVARGTRKLRITGGEPLVRNGIMKLFGSLSRHLAVGALDELTLTTNGSLLSRYAAELADCGVKRVNVSLDTIDPQKFPKIARRGNLTKVLDGISAAQAAGLSVKINAVALSCFEDKEFCALVEWAHERGIDISFIEVMPLGEIDEQRVDQYLPVDRVRAYLASRWTLDDIKFSTGGPARYVRVRETSGRIGFIAPMTHNFCESCNRVRVTCTGMLYMCLGKNDAVDLRAPLRASPDDVLLNAAIDLAISRKPKGHDFIIERAATPAVARHMSATGG